LFGLRHGAALVTQAGLAKLGDTNQFDPDSPYREAYAAIWASKPPHRTALSRRPQVGFGAAQGDDNKPAARQAVRCGAVDLGDRPPRRLGGAASGANWKGSP
jgi:hypothetical protein